MGGKDPPAGWSPQRVCTSGSELSAPACQPGTARSTGQHSEHSQAGQMTRLPNVSQFLSRMSLLEPNAAAVEGSGSRPEFKHRTRTHEPSQVGFTAQRIH